MGYTGYSSSGIIMLESDGTADNTFGTGINGNTFSIELQPDGKILVGGIFDEYNGTSVGYGLIRLESDGTIDTTFNIGIGFDNDVQTIALQSDGKILVGGGFTYVRNLFAPRFAELLVNGIQGEYIALELFSDCEECNGYIIPKSANTEYIECLICEGDALLVDAPHPVWTGLNGGAVTQLDAVTIGGNGWNS
jgi:hypothetical protein